MSMNAGAMLWGGLCLCSTLFLQAGAADPAPAAPLLRLLGEGVEYSMAHPAPPDSPKPYFFSSAVVDTRSVSIWGSLGALHRNDQDRQRSLDVEVRVGDYALDSTHQIRGRGDDRRSGRILGASSSIAMDDDPAAV